MAGGGGIGNKAQLRPAKLELGLGLSLTKDCISYFESTHISSMNDKSNHKVTNDKYGFKQRQGSSSKALSFSLE